MYSNDLILVHSGLSLRGGGVWGPLRNSAVVEKKIVPVRLKFASEGEQDYQRKKENDERSA